MKNPKGISFAKTLDKLFQGKSCTRRLWSDRTVKTFTKYYEDGRIIPAYDKSPRNGGKIVGWLTLTQKPYQDELINMTRLDLKAEGFPTYTVKQFIEEFFDGKNQQVWVIWFRFEPIPADSSPTAVIGFAGGGGVECGMLAAGVKPVLSIEFDPTKPDLSNAIADCHELNFNSPLLRMTVQDWAAQNFPECPEKVDFAHFSPVCSNFSQETNRGDQKDDLSAAVAIAEFIASQRATAITLENVPAYRYSASWAIINSALLENGYLPNTKIWDFSHYGVPQARKRFICVAIKGGWFPLFQPQNPIGWLQAIADLIPNLKETRLLPIQREVLLKAQNQPYLIPRLGYRNKPNITPGFKPSPTIKRSIFTDQKGSNRRKVWTIWDGQHALNADIEVFRRLQTFPDWYRFPSSMGVAGSIIGYSVPPLIVQQIYSVLVRNFNV